MVTPSHLKMNHQLIVQSYQHSFIESLMNAGGSTFLLTSET